MLGTRSLGCGKPFFAIGCAAARVAGVCSPLSESGVCTAELTPAARSRCGVAFATARRMGALRRTLGAVECANCERFPTKR